MPAPPDNLDPSNLALFLDVDGTLLENAVVGQEALDVVRGSMRQIRGLAPGQEDNFELITQDEFIELWDKLTGVLFAVMVALSGVGLMVGGVGVIGIMMISVTERTREIGVRKALGATRRTILWQFLVEGATLTSIGASVGLLAGGLLAIGIRTWTSIPASIPLPAIAASLAAAAVNCTLWPGA